MLFVARFVLLSDRTSCERANEVFQARQTDEFVAQQYRKWYGFCMTKRADLHEQREQALEKFGLSKADFLTKSYRPAGTMGELSDEQLEEAIEMASLGAFEVAIARVLGVDTAVFTSTLRKGKIGESKRYEDFARRFYDARKQHMKKSLRVMNEAVEGGDWKPAAWQLERSFGFAKQEVVEHDVTPQTFSLMQLAQIPVEEAREALLVEGEVVVEPDDAA